MLHSISKGSGPKQIIFIHGNSQSSESWERVMNSNILNDYTLTAIDLPGHGNSFRSSDPLKDYTLKGLARHVYNFIGQFDDQPYVLVSNSLGANIIGEFAGKIQNCKGIMLVGSSAVGMGLGVPEIIQPNPNVGICFTAEFTQQQLEALVDDAVYSEDENVKSFLRTTFSNTDPAFRATLAESVGKGDYSDELQNIKNSNLTLALAYGENEKLCVCNGLDKLELKKWRNKTILIPGSGHCSHLDQPEKLAVLVGEFAADCFALNLTGY